MDATVQKALDEGTSLNVRPLAKAAGVAAATLYRAISRGEIEAIQIGKRVTVPAHVARKLLKLPEAPAVVKAA